jgi:hypothetical protein
MDDHSDRQLEMLGKIHNQLADLKQIIVEIELAKPDTSEELRASLSKILSNEARIDAARHGDAPATRQQKVIAPSDTGIKPGESR